jgi:hypothetical protein
VEWSFQDTPVKISIFVPKNLNKHSQNISALSQTLSVSMRFGVANNR